MLNATGRKKFRIASPSWVFPGTVMENCAFLEGKVDEVALLLFEFHENIKFPPELSTLDLTFHAHLPLDLPWAEGGTVVAEVCLELLETIRFLDVTRAVLHPPPATEGEKADACRKNMDAFVTAWTAAGRRPVDLFLENTHENDLTCLKDFFLPNGGKENIAGTLGICPDLGHILAYGQENFYQLLLTLPNGAKPRMLHCNAPGKGPSCSEHKSWHNPLDTLDDNGLALGEKLCSTLAPDAVIVAELFDWRYIQRSLPIIRNWLEAIYQA